MTLFTRLLRFALVAIAAAVGAGCVDEGIGIGVPAPGMRITGSANTPPVLVRGGPVYEQ